MSSATGCNICYEILHFPDGDAENNPVRDTMRIYQLCERHLTRSNMHYTKSLYVRPDAYNRLWAAKSPDEDWESIKEKIKDD